MGNPATWALRKWYGLGDTSLDAVLSEVYNRLGSGKLEESVAQHLNSLAFKVNPAGSRKWFTAAYTKAYQNGSEAATAARNVGLDGGSQMSEFSDQHQGFNYELSIALENAVSAMRETAAIPASEKEIALAGTLEELSLRVKQAIILTGISNTGNCRSTFERLMDYAYLAGASSVFAQQGLFLLAAHAYAGMRYAKSALVLGER